eukprot:3937881-Rhodomonas_salina.1
MTAPLRQASRRMAPPTRRPSALKRSRSASLPLLPNPQTTHTNFLCVHTSCPCPCALPGPRAMPVYPPPPRDCVDCVQRLCVPWLTLFRTRVWDAVDEGGPSHHLTGNAPRSVHARLLSGCEARR